MYSLNKVQIIGNITNDLELKQTPSGQNVMSFGVATKRVWSDANGVKQENTEFHNIVLWAKLAEIASQYASKGTKIYIEGRLQTRNWEAQDGTKRYRTEIVGENMILLSKSGEPISTPAANTTPASKKSSPAKEEEISIDEVPF